MKKIINTNELEAQLEEEPVVKNFEDVISNMQGGAAGGLRGIIFCGACQVPLPGPPAYDKAKALCIKFGAPSAASCPSHMYNILKCNSYEDCLAACLMLELGVCLDRFTRCKNGDIGACAGSALCVAAALSAIGKIIKLPGCKAGQPPPPCCYPVDSNPFSSDYGDGGQRNLDCQLKNLETLSDSDFEKFWDALYKALHESGYTPITAGDGDPALGGTPGIYEEEIKNPPKPLNTQSKRELVRRLGKRIRPLLRN